MRREMNKQIAIIVVLVLVFLSGCGKEKEAILAKIDDDVVTLNEFNKRISKLPEQYQQAVAKDKTRLLEDLVIELLFYKEAIRRGIDKQSDTKEVLREARKKILMAKFIEEEVEKTTSVNDAEVRDYYEENKDKFIEPEKFRASHILVKTEEKAQELLDILSTGKDFEEVASTESMDITNKRGGDIGYFRKGQLVPEFEQACMKLEIGQVSPIVKTSFGYHIIKLTDKVPTSTKTFEEVKEKIASELLMVKRKEKFNKVIRDLKNKAYIEINYELIQDDDEDQ